MSRSPTAAELLDAEAACKMHAALGDPGVRNRIAELEAILRDARQELWHRSEAIERFHFADDPLIQKIDAALGLPPPKR